MKTTRLAVLTAVLSVRLAAADTDAVTPLPEVRVTATPIIQENRLTPLAGEVTVVTAQQIADLSAQDLQSALRETPGVVVTHYDPVGSFGGGQGGAIFIRGMGASRPGAEIQLSIDGIANYNSLWTHPLLDMLSVDIAQSIDVYKGAQPVLYGNMAFGVVDVTTKRQAVPGFSTSLQTAYGSYNTFAEVAEQGGKVDNFDYYLVQSYRSSDGDRPHSDGELQNYFGRFGYAMNQNWDAHVVFNRTDNYADDPGVLNSGSNNGRFNDDDDLVIATLENHYDKADGYVKAYWNRGTLNWVNQLDSNTHLNQDITLTDYDNDGVKTRETFKPWDGGALMAGVDADFISGKDYTLTAGAPACFPRTKFQIVQPYASVSQRWNLDNNTYLQPSAGVRYFDHDVFESEFAPQAGLVFGLTDTELHASYARGINYPGIFVAAMPALNEPSYRSLHAETLDHDELGASRQFGTLAKLDVTLFHDSGRNRIVFDPTKPPFPFPWENIGRFHTQGLETTVTVAPLRDLSLFAGFTILSADPGNLPYAPKRTASAGVSYRFIQHFHLSVDGQYVGNQNALTLGPNPAVSTSPISSYSLVNAKLSCDFSLPDWGLRGEIFVSGQNLTNAHYQQQYGYPMPGTNGMGGVRVSF
jgi:iron complex outermembrane receptor protein